MKYYRNPEEPIGQSLYRDFKNRRVRQSVATLNLDVKAKLETDKKHEAPMTQKLLTQKLERNVEHLLQVWLG